MSTQLARRAVKAFPRSECADRRTVNGLRRGWIRSVQTLGAKWILAQVRHLSADKADRAIGLTAAVALPVLIAIDLATKVSG